MQAVEMYQSSMTKLCCSVRYHLILTDIQMPHLDGIKEAQRIMQLQQELRKDDPSLPEIVIAMVTAFESQSMQEKLRRMGINDYLTKPVDERTIFNLLQRVFNT